jgi:hypothetical protein
MLAAGRFAAKYVKDTDDEEGDSHDEKDEFPIFFRILRGWLLVPPFLEGESGFKIGMIPEAREIHLSKRDRKAPIPFPPTASFFTS